MHHVLPLLAGQMRDFGRPSRDVIMSPCRCIDALDVELSAII